MKTLGIDSTASTATVALTENGRILAAYSIASGTTHSTTLLPMTKSVLSVTGLSVSDIDLFALSAGPGSFTGVRIGAATVKGLAFPRNTPCIGVSSLEAMAWNLRELCGVVFASINARRQTLFCAAFECDGKSAPVRLTEDAALSAAEACEYCRSVSGRRVYAVGDGASLIEEELCGILSPVPEIIKNQNAVGVCLAAEAIWSSAGESERISFTHENLNPVYLKKPQAEREREERLASERSGRKNTK